MTCIEELKQYQNYDQDGLNSAFFTSCKKRNLELMKYLLTSSELKVHADIHGNDDLGFRWACAYGHLDVVKYLLTSPDLKEHADIHARDDFGFQLACENGHLEVVKYLLTSTDLTDHANIGSQDHYGFMWACRYGHLAVVKYLLTSQDLNQHANIHAYDDGGFQWACENGHLEIVQYLLSFNGKQCIDFQVTEYDLNWAIQRKYNDVIIAMMKNLKNNNLFDYLTCLSKVEMYSRELYEQVKNIKIELEINSSVPELFV